MGRESGAERERQPGAVTRVAAKQLDAARWRSPESRAVAIKILYIVCHCTRHPAGSQRDLAGLRAKSEIRRQTVDVACERSMGFLGWRGHEIVIGEELRVRL